MPYKALRGAAVKGGRRTRRYDRPVSSRRKGYYRSSGRASGALVMTPERKYFTSQRLGFDVPAATSWAASTLADPDTTPVANMNCLFAPTVGSAINQRIGRKVSVHKIQLKGELTVASLDDETTADASNTVRMILFMDQQTNGTQVTPSELIAAQTASAGSAVYGFQNLANLGRFRVLKDKIITLQNPNVSWDGTNVIQQGIKRTFKIVINFKRPVVVHFNAVNGGTVADIVDNSFHLAANSTNETDLDVGITYTARVTYTDV